NSTLPASSSTSAARASRDSGARASAASATPCPKACTAAVCASTRTGSAAPCAAQAPSATPAAASSAPLARSQPEDPPPVLLTAARPETPRAASRGCGARTTMTSALPGLFLQLPEHLELALRGKGRVDDVHVVLVRAAGDLVAVGHRPGADRIAHVLQLGHEARVLAARRPHRFDPDVFDRGAFGALDLQLALVHCRGLGHGRGVVAVLLVGIVAGGVALRLATDRQDHVEGVVLAPELGRNDAQRAGRHEVVGVHGALDPLL